MTQTHLLPVEKFEELIGEGLWVGHQFEWNGQQWMIASIGQAIIQNGQRFVPVEIEIF
jgi:hypothetical protein